MPQPLRRPPSIPSPRSSLLQLISSALSPFARKVRVVLDWTLALFFKRDIVSLGSLQRPREEFSEASR